MWMEITDAQGKHHGTIQVEIEVMCLKDTFGRMRVKGNHQKLGGPQHQGEINPADNLISDF